MVVQGLFQRIMHPVNPKGRPLNLRPLSFHRLNLERMGESNYVTNLSIKLT